MMPFFQRAQQNFFSQETIKVAQNLLGCRLHCGNESFIISETEAYLSQDPASHSFKGISNKNASMFEKAGTFYIYLIYGMHYCLNIVCALEGQGEAVLLRGIQNQHVFLNGPGKLTKHLGLKNTLLNGVFIEDSKSPIQIFSTFLSEKLKASFPKKVFGIPRLQKVNFCDDSLMILQSYRVGLNPHNEGHSLLYRFLLANHF